MYQNPSNFDLKAKQIFLKNIELEKKSKKYLSVTNLSPGFLFVMILMQNSIWKKNILQEKEIYFFFLIYICKMKTKSTGLSKLLIISFIIYIMYELYVYNKQLETQREEQERQRKEKQKEEEKKKNLRKKKIIILFLAITYCFVLLLRKMAININSTKKSGIFILKSSRRIV